MLSSFSRVQLFVTLRTVALQAPLSVKFSRQEYCIGLPCPPPDDLPDPEIELVSLMTPESASRFFTTLAPLEAFGSGLTLLLLNLPVPAAFTICYVCLKE